MTGFVIPLNFRQSLAYIQWRIQDIFGGMGPLFLVYAQSFKKRGWGWGSDIFIANYYFKSAGRVRTPLNPSESAYDLSVYIRLRTWELTPLLHELEQVIKELFSFGIIAQLVELWEGLQESKSSLQLGQKLLGICVVGG